MNMEESISNSTQNNKARICGLCEQNTSKYCCPRCNVLYCSLDCYKSETHAECSESFYRDCINEELALQQADDESKNKMIDILKKMHENNDTEDIDAILGNDDDDDSDDNDEEDLHERIKDLDINDADALWKVLTDDERNEFEALLNNGDVGAIMPQWVPWWVGSEVKKLVKDIDKCAEELRKCPEILEVPKLNTLTNIQPSPAIRFNITNVLSSYVFIMRYFNGEIDPVEGVTYLLNICANLDTNTNFDDINTAIESVAQKCLQSELIHTDETSLNVMRHDTNLVLEGPSDDNKAYYCKSALSHLNKMFGDAKKAEKSSKNNSDNSKEVNGFSKKFPEHGRSHLPKLDISKVKKCMRKVEYYLSFIETYDMMLTLTFQSELIHTDETSLNVMRDDTNLVLEGPSDDNKAYYCKAALSHLNKMFCDAKKAEKSSKNNSDKSKEVNGFSKMFPEHGRSHLPKLDISKVKKCMRKVEYYLSFIETYGKDAK